MSSESAELEWHRTSPIAVVFILFRTIRQVAFNSLLAVIVVVAAFASGGSGRKTLMATGAVFLMGLGVIDLPDEAVRRRLQTGRRKFCRIYFELTAQSALIDAELVERWLWPMAAGRLSEGLVDAENRRLLRLLARRREHVGRLVLDDLLAVIDE